MSSDMRVAIAAAGKGGAALHYRMNRTRPDGSTRYGITVIRPGDILTGNRWDVVIVLPAGPETTEREREDYAQWCREVLPTKLMAGAEVVWL